MTIARPLTFLLTLCLLSGCVKEIYYREGATTAEVDRARDACAVEAYRSAPVLHRTRIIPGPLIPPRKVCDASGACVIYPATQGLPEIERYDANVEKRAVLTRSCLAERGYARVSLPYCDASAKSSVPVGVTRTLPRLTEQSCIISRGPNAYQIVTR